MVAALTSVALLGSVRAATLIWDSDASGTATDGSGTWNTTTANWILAGTTHTTWNNATPDSAVIGSGGTAGTITLGEPITVGNITFNTVAGNYIVTGSTLTLPAHPHFIRVAPTISPRLTQWLQVQVGL